MQPDAAIGKSGGKVLFKQGKCRGGDFIGQAAGAGQRGLNGARDELAVAQAELNALGAKTAVAQACADRFRQQIAQQTAHVLGIFKVTRRRGAVADGLDGAGMRAGHDGGGVAAGGVGFEQSAVFA